MVVAAGAGMLSGTNLKALDELELSFIVGSRVTKAPGDLESRASFRSVASDLVLFGQTSTPRTEDPRSSGSPRPGHRRRNQDSQISAARSPAIHVPAALS